MASIPIDLACVNKNRFSGKPCLAGTRVPVAQIIAEIADGRSVDELADDMNLPADKIRNLLEQIALAWDVWFDVEDDNALELTLEPRSP
jgi:uncharacterized protein (DUF433 family)